VTAQPALPDVESVLVGWMGGLLGDARVCTDLPADLSGNAPLVQVRRITGGVSSRTQDAAVVDVHAFGADDAAASELAIQAETLLLGSRNITTGGAVVRGSESVVRPRWVPYVDTSVRLYAATYTIRLHPTPAA
jgi:hypothetical protein